MEFLVITVWKLSVLCLGKGEKNVSCQTSSLCTAEGFYSIKQTLDLLLIYSVFYHCDDHNIYNI